MSRPALDDVAERAYSLAQPIATADEANGWVALHLVAGLTRGIQPVWELAEGPGARVALHPATCDPKWLPLIAQAVGGRLRGGMTLEQRRAECIRPIGWTAGLAAELPGVAAPHMAPNGRVNIRFRYDGVSADAPLHLSVRIRASDVLPGHEVDVVRDVGDAIPAHLLADIEVSDYATFDDRRDAHEDFDAMTDAYDDFDHMRNA